MAAPAASAPAGPTPARRSAGRARPARGCGGGRSGDRGLAGADHRPLDVAHRLPPPQALGLRRLAPRRLVGVEELLAARRARPPGGRRCRTATSGCRASPCPRPGSPAWHSSQSITAARPPLVDDQVAEPEVAVDERLALRRRRAVEPQPAQARPRRPAAARRSGRAPPPTARRRRAPGRRPARRRRRPPRARSSGSRASASPSSAGQALAGRRVARRAAGPAAPPTCPRRGPSGTRRSRSARPAGSKRSGAGTGTPAAAPRA